MNDAAPVTHSSDRELLPLSPREAEVLQLAANGKTTVIIAAELSLSPSTVQTHFEHIHRKFEAKNRVEAVAEGFRRGYIS